MSLSALADASSLQHDVCMQDLFLSAKVLAANGDWATAAERWEQAAALGHVPSHAALAEIYYEGRPGVARWFDRAAELSTRGASAGCGDCKVGKSLNVRLVTMLCRRCDDSSIT